MFVTSDMQHHYGDFLSDNDLPSHFSIRNPFQCCTSFSLLWSSNYFTHLAHFCFTRQELHSNIILFYPKRRRPLVCIRVLSPEVTWQLSSVSFLLKQKCYCLHAGKNSSVVTYVTYHHVYPPKPFSVMCASREGFCTWSLACNAMEVFPHLNTVYVF